MKSRAGVLWEQPGKWEVIEVDLDAPQTGEVLVEMVATGLCHSDDHFTTGDAPIGTVPYCGGHEGGGIVRELGPGVTDLAVGDHVVTSFIPACGRCTWCASGRQYLCDFGALILSGSQVDGTYRMHVDGRDVGTMCTLGTFATWQVYHQTSLIKISPDIPLNVACLVACGVPTGWGSAVNGAVVEVGDVVIVMGVGGVGINAVQGARFAGAAHVIAVDPVAFKRETALKLGADAAFADIEEGAEYARTLTNGQGANSTIVTVGVMENTHVTQALASVGKSGTVALTSVSKYGPTDVTIDLIDLGMGAKRIQGVLYGLESPRVQIPKLLGLYQQGHLKLDELITHRYSFDNLNEAYADLRAGVNIRGVVDF